MALLTCHTVNLVSSLIWSIIECSIGIVCVSIPPIRPLLAKLFPRQFKSGNVYKTPNNRYAMQSRSRNTKPRDDDAEMSGKTVTTEVSSSEVEEGRAKSTPYVVDTRDIGPEPSAEMRDYDSTEELTRPERIGQVRRLRDQNQD
jgi:hypothetical protein